LGWWHAFSTGRIFALQYEHVAQLRYKKSIEAKKYNQTYLHILKVVISRAGYLLHCHTIPKQGAVKLSGEQGVRAPVGRGGLHTRWNVGSGGG
jgi:hypothetical protein